MREHLRKDKQLRLLGKEGGGMVYGQEVSHRPVHVSSTTHFQLFPKHYFPRHCCNAQMCRNVGKQQ